MAQGFATPAVRRLLELEREERAQGLTDPDIHGIIELATPGTIKNELEALRASYEVVNQTAKGRPEWDAHYGEFRQFYDQNKDPGWLSGANHATLRNVRQRSRRLEEWKEKLRTEGVRVGEPDKHEPPPSKEFEGLGTIVKWGAIGMGVWFAGKALSGLSKEAR